MASKSKTQARALERAARLEELKRQAKAEERRRNLMVGGVVAAVVAIVVVVLVLVTLGNEDVDATAAGESDYGLVVGSTDAPREVVIYEDFLCPFCGELERATGEELAQLAEDGEVVVDYRPFTLLDRYGPYSAEAVSALGVVMEESEPAVAQEFHRLLFADQPAEDAGEFPDADWFVDKAVEAGAEEDAVRPGIEAGENDFAREATAEAREAGIDGTPTVLVDGEVFNGDAEELLEELGK